MIVNRGNYNGIQIDKLKLCLIPNDMYLFKKIYDGNGKIELDDNIYIEKSKKLDFWRIYINAVNDDYICYAKLNLKHNKYFINIENDILYKNVGLPDILLYIISALDATFNNVTQIDLCKDFDIDIIEDKIKKIKKNKKYNLIFNGKKKEKDADDKRIRMYANGSFENEDKYKTLEYVQEDTPIKQKFIRIYDKKSELEQESPKKKEYQGIDSDIHYRMEVVLSNEPLYEILNSPEVRYFFGSGETEENKVITKELLYNYLLFDVDFLNYIYYKVANQIIHFSRKDVEDKHLYWQDILDDESFVADRIDAKMRKKMGKNNAKNVVANPKSLKKFLGN